ncbi:hypothetical protein CPB86DRAFT_829876 [Serendipita vermifera]|nr:hypothetical protein CPB86DRAFT_829876 [Serendipita vermifera]
MDSTTVNPTLRAIQAATETSSVAEVTQNLDEIERAIDEWLAVRDSSTTASPEIQASIYFAYGKVLRMRWHQSMWKDDIDGVIAAFQSAQQRLPLVANLERLNVSLDLGTAYYERYTNLKPREEGDILNACQAWEEARKLQSNPHLYSPFMNRTLVKLGHAYSILYKDNLSGPEALEKAIGLYSHLVEVTSPEARGDLHLHMAQWYSELAFLYEDIQSANWSIDNYERALELGVSSHFKRIAVNEKSLMLWKSVDMNKADARSPLYEWVVSSVRKAPSDPVSLMYYSLVLIIDMTLVPAHKRNKAIAQCKTLLEAAQRGAKILTIPIPPIVHYLIPLLLVIEYGGLPQNKQLPSAAMPAAFQAMTHLEAYAEKADWKDFVSIRKPLEKEPSHFDLVMKVYDRIAGWVRAGFMSLLPIGSSQSDPPLMDRSDFERCLIQRSKKPFLFEEEMGGAGGGSHMSPVPLFL